MKKRWTAPPRKKPPAVHLRGHPKYDFFTLCGFHIVPPRYTSDKREVTCGRCKYLLATAVKEKFLK